MSSLYVRESGAGPTVMLIGGCPTPAEMMKPLADALAGRVLLPDLPGYGLSPAPEGAYTMDSSNAMIEQALIDRGIQETDLVGYSLGAYRALSLALRGRVRVRKLGMLSGFAGLDAPACEGMRQFSGAVRARVDLSEAFVARMLAPAYAAAHPEACEAVKRWPDATTPEVLSDELSAVADVEDLRPRLGEIRVPLLLRVGELDEAAPLPGSQEIAGAVASALLEVVPGAGHALFYEDLAETIASVRRFLAA